MSLDLDDDILAEDTELKRALGKDQKKPQTVVAGKKRQFKDIEGSESSKGAKNPPNSVRAKLDKNEKLKSSKENSDESKEGLPLSGLTIVASGVFDKIA